MRTEDDYSFITDRLAIGNVASRATHRLGCRPRLGPRQVDAT